MTSAMDHDRLLFLPPPRRPATDSPDRREVARVLDMSEVRRGTRTVPPEVREEIDRAAALAVELLRAGREIRFEAPSDGGRVRIELVELDGTLVRPLTLHEAMALDGVAPHAAPVGA